MILLRYIGLVYFLAGIFINRPAAQTPATWLASAWKDSTYRKMLARADFRSGHPLTIHWLDKLEFRTQTSDFNFKQQQYALRFSPSDPAEINYRKRLESVDVKFYRQLAQDALHDALATRYHLLVEYYWMEKQDSLFKEQLALHQKKTQYLESLFEHQLDAELKDLVQAYRKNEKIKLESGVLKDTRKLTVQQSMAHGVSGELRLDGFQWIQPAAIRALIRNDQDLIPVSASYARLLQNQSQAELETLRLKEDGWNILEFLQARWRNNTNDELIREKISLGAGFRIPLPGGKRRDQNLVVLEKMQIESEIDQYEMQYRSKTKTLKQELTAILDQLEEQEKQLHQFENRFRQPALMSNPLVKPQDILLIEETILDWKEEILDIEKKLMRKYVEYLDHNRWISTPPYKNYLAAGMEGLIIED